MPAQALTGKLTGVRFFGSQAAVQRELVITAMCFYHFDLAYFYHLSRN